MHRFIITASDGSKHTYPEGFIITPEGDWIYVKDESHKLMAAFYKPILATFL